MTDEREAEISDAVMQEIASARRLVFNACPEHQVELLRRGAEDVWRAWKIDKTLYPDRAAATKIAAADALYEIGAGIGLDVDVGQRIIAAAVDAADEEVGPAMNGHAAAVDEPPPAVSPDDYGKASRPRLIDLDNIPLSIGEWLQRDLPAPDPIMGQWFTTTSRIALNAATGIGKTNFALALAGHISAGRDFLHWRAHRPARVLFVDGEMSRRLLKRRAQDVCRRCGFEPEGLFILSHEDIEGFQPLNTAAGKALIEQVIERIGSVDAIIFDNVMALIAGDMKEEDGWQRALPLVDSLTMRGIGQLWVHHTGHDVTRGYGTKTREWRMDTVIHLTEEKRADTDVSFRLEFHKARERPPETRRDFEDVTIALIDDEWTCSAAIAKQGKPAPLELKFLEALQDALAGDETTKYQTWNAVKADQWRAECFRRGLLDMSKPDSARTLFNRYKRDLIAHNLIACNDELVWLRY
jgi:AAA domain